MDYFLLTALLLDYNSCNLVIRFTFEASVEYCGLYEECVSLDDSHQTAISGDKYHKQTNDEISPNSDTFLFCLQVK